MKQITKHIELFEILPPAMMVQSPYLMDEADAQLPKFYGSATNDIFGELAHAAYRRKRRTSKNRKNTIEN